MTTFRLLVTICSQMQMGLYFPDLATGGLAFARDLTACDPTFVLPVISWLAVHVGVCCVTYRRLDGLVFRSRFRVRLRVLRVHSARVIFPVRFFYFPVGLDFSDGVGDPPLFPRSLDQTS